jgi:cysteine desulfurase family protein (TIGR01976 family)
MRAPGTPGAASDRLVAVDVIRSRFPALARVHDGQPVAYFDGPGGTQVPRIVVDAMADYLFHHNANTNWRYPTSVETDEALADARAAVADFLNGDPAEVVFGANMTTLTFHLARALGRGWSAGDEVVVTELDHHANVAPWQAVARERGITIRTARMCPDTGELDWEDFARVVTPRTRLVAVGAASNALGTINDVERAAGLARTVGAWTFVDAVHHAPHALVDVRAMGCDFLACSAYKFYGPHVGILWGKRDLLETLDVPKLQPAPDHAPDRLETGTQNHEGIVGTRAAVDFLASLTNDAAASRRARLGDVMAALHQRGQPLVERLWHGLRSIPGVNVYGPPPERPRTPTIAFTIAGCSSDEVALAYADRGVFVSNGDFYATTVVERLGLADQGVVRVGCACYTTASEVNRVIDGARVLARGGPSSMRQGEQIPR